VELAVVLPLLLLLLMGTIEACAAIHLQQSLDITAYEAARTSLLPKATIYTVNEAADKFLTSRKTNGAKVVVAPSNFESLPIGTIITITVSAPSQGNLPVSPFFFQDRTITSSCSMMKEYQ
jgi:Flp pilus assembly protein TadG